MQHSRVFIRFIGYLQILLISEYNFSELINFCSPLTKSEKKRFSDNFREIEVNSLKFANHLKENLETIRYDTIQIKKLYQVNLICDAVAWKYPNRLG